MLDAASLETESEEEDGAAMHNAITARSPDASQVRQKGGNGGESQHGQKSANKRSKKPPSQDDGRAGGSADGDGPAARTPQRSRGDQVGDAEKRGTEVRAPSRADASPRAEKSPNHGKGSRALSSGAPPSGALGSPPEKKARTGRILPNFDAHKPYRSMETPLSPVDTKAGMRLSQEEEPPTKRSKALPQAGAQEKRRTSLIEISSDESDGEAAEAEAEPAAAAEPTAAAALDGAVRARLATILQRPPPPKGHDFHPYASSLALVRAAWLAGLE